MKNRPDPEDMKTCPCNPLQEHWCSYKEPERKTLSEFGKGVAIGFLGTFFGLLLGVYLLSWAIIPVEEPPRYIECVRR